MSAWLTRLIVMGFVATTLLAPDSAHAIRCRITVSPINFGTYMPLSPSNVDVVGQFNVRCQAQPGTFTITIGPGLSGNQFSRTLVSAGQPLRYNLYRDAARTQVWGDGTPPSFVVTGRRTNRGPPDVLQLPGLRPYFFRAVTEFRRV